MNEKNHSIYKTSHERGLDDGTHFYKVNRDHRIQRIMYEKIFDGQADLHIQSYKIRWHTPSSEQNIGSNMNEI